MTYDIEAFNADIPADILAILGDAEAAYSDPDQAERALLAALERAPDNLALRMATYTFYFYANRRDPSVADDVLDRPDVGRLCHEGVQQGPRGEVFVVNEFNGGSIFKFVPDRVGDLSSGQLYALKILGISDAQQLYDGVANNDVHVGNFEWVAIDDANATFPEDDPNDPEDGPTCADGHQAAADVEVATQLGRPEDLQRIGAVLYVANTSENRILAIDLSKHTVAEFVAVGKNVPIEPGNPETAKSFNSPDNLAKGPDGRLWIVEDNSPSDIWVADFDRDGDGLADNVGLFASMQDSGAEGTGIYFGKDPQTLFVNVQHAAKPLADGTWIITRRKGNKHDKHKF